MPIREGAIDEMKLREMNSCMNDVLERKERLLWIRKGKRCQKRV
jgi:hypothetical protein